MQAARDHIAYEVTISEELRTLFRARNSSVPHGPARHSGSSAGVGAQMEVFSERRLRIDGRRPVRVSATELLTLAIEYDPGASLDDLSDRNGGQSVSILLAEDGTCIAHMVAEPPAGVPARPVYRLEKIREPLDLVSLLSKCHRDLALCGFNAADTAFEDLAPPHSQLLVAQSTRMTEALAPFCRIAP